MEVQGAVSGLNDLVKTYISFLNYPHFNTVSEDIMTKLLKLASGHFVTRGSKKPLSPVGAVEFAAGLQMPLQTGDLAVIVRDELDKSSLLDEREESTLDGSDLYQRLSDVALFYNHKGKPWIAVSNLLSMYGTNWSKHIEAAKKIGWGKNLPINGDLVKRLLDTAGKRKAQMPEEHWPYATPSATLSKDKIALTVFPQEAGRYGAYLTRKERDTCHFYLLGSSVPDCLNDNRTGVVRPLGLGGDAFINYVNADVNFNYDGRARAGSAGAKNSP